MNANDVREALYRRWPDDRCLHIPEAPLDSSRQGTKIDVLVMHMWHSEQHRMEAVEIKVSYSDWRKEIVRVEWWNVWPDGTERKMPSRMHALAETGIVPTKDRWWWTYGREIKPYIPQPAIAHGGFPTVERRVIADTSKSAPWRRHAHRFWVAAPIDLAKRIVDEAPADWGVLAITDDGNTRALRNPKTKLTSEVTPLTHAQYLGLLRASCDVGPAALMRSRQAGYEEARRRFAAIKERTT